MANKGVTLFAVVVLCFAASSGFAESDKVTFTKDVAPIFQAKCESCHRPNSIAPMSLVSFQESRPWAAAIKEAVETREMPPWHIDKTVGIQEFDNDRSLSQEQIETIVKWVDAGAPRGNPADMPPPVRWPEGEDWMFADRFDEPDLVVRSTPYTMPAQSPDVWYRPVVETGLTEARWVRAIEIRPSKTEGRKIMHHALARLQQEDPEDDGGQEHIEPGLFMEWAVGKQGELMRPQSGKLMLPGSKIAWDIHYHAVGEEITSQAELAIYFYPKGDEPKYRQDLGIYHAITGSIWNLDIPPNEISVHEGFTVMKAPGRVENFQPHMHLRGKAMAMEAMLPDGTSQVLSHVDNFQFDWHVNYVYADHVAPLLPKGTILKFTAWHDNTVANRYNPDPDQWVGWGDRTVDEMAHAWVNITYMDEEAFAAEVEKRKVLEGEPTEEEEDSRP